MGNFRQKGEFRGKGERMVIEHIFPSKKAGEKKPELRGLVPILQENGHLSVALGSKGARMLS